MKKTLENLQIAYDGLIELIKKNTEIERDFDMKTFGVFTRKTLKEVKNHECDTCGCLLGNIARVLPIEETDFDPTSLIFSYRNFGYRLFSSLYKYEGWFRKSLWHFLFDVNWRYNFPTFEAAMDRLKYFIDSKGDIGEYGIDWSFEKGIINNKLK